MNNRHEGAETGPRRRGQIEEFLLAHWLRPEAPTAAASIRAAQSLAAETGAKVPAASQLAGLLRAHAAANPAAVILHRRGVAALRAFVRRAPASPGPAARSQEAAMPSRPRDRRR